MLHLWFPIEGNHQEGRHGETVELDADGGLEMFVIEGSVQESSEDFAAWDWLRLPPGDNASAQAGASGARVWMQPGHLNQMV